MVELDRGSRTVGRGAALDHVGIERALGQEPGPGDSRRLAGKAVDEGLADPAPLLLGLGHTGKDIEKPRFGGHHVQIAAEVGGELLDHRGRLTLSQQAVVDQDAGELIADRPAEQGCHHGGVHATGETTDHPVAAHSLPQRVDHRGGEVVEPPGTRAAAGGLEEVGEDLPAGRRVGDLGMELKPEHRQAPVPDGRQRAGGRAGQRQEFVAQTVHLVAMAHPDLGVIRHVGQQQVVVEHFASGPAVFAGLRPADLPSQGLAGQLHPVADAEHGDAQPEDVRIALRGGGFVDARRAA